MNASHASRQRMFCTFRVNNQLFGVDILDVKEVTAETTFTGVAHSPDEVLGLVNIRGHIYLALGLRQLLGMPAALVTADSRLVLFKPSVGSAFGVVVDEICDVQAVAADRIESFAAVEHETVAVHVDRVDLIDAVCELTDELLVILSPRRFLAVVEQSFAV
jgi:purine-binding chemotaxis protein CheW